MIVSWDTKKRQFLAWKFIISPITQKPLDVRSWNLDTMWVLVNSSWKPSLGVHGNVTKLLQAENRQKVDNLKRYIAIISDIDEKWFVIFEHTINHFFLIMFVYPKLNAVFSVLHLFSYVFSFFLPLSTFKPRNALSSKSERLKILWSISVQQKSGVLVGWILLNEVVQNFELLSH